MKTNIHLTETIPDSLAGQRLDLALASLFSQYSRAQLQNWIRAKKVKVDGKTWEKPREKVASQQLIQIDAELEARESWQAKAIPLNILFEDESLIIVNKPAGLTVHPGAGNYDETLVNALLHYSPKLALLPRAGLIHRLDKNTSGLLVIARTLESHAALVQAMQAHEIKREYEALVHGVIIAGGRIDAPIGRHPTMRTRMAVSEQGKPAVTHYRIVEKYAHFTRIRVRLETGRTHQIRVHMAHIGFPLVGDPVYTKRILTGSTFKRQALHAAHLELIHPNTRQLISWDAPLPSDMLELIDFLKKKT